VPCTGHYEARIFQVEDQPADTGHPVISHSSSLVRSTACEVGDHG